MRVIRQYRTFHESDRGAGVLRSGEPPESGEAAVRLTGYEGDIRVFLPGHQRKGGRLNDCIQYLSSGSMIEEVNQTIEKTNVSKRCK
jgi:hypothetical protein